MKDNGFAPLVILIILTILIGTGFLFFNKPKDIQIVEVKLTATLESRPTQTVLPTLTSTPTIMATVKPTNTPIPTMKPVSGPPGSGLSTINVATERGNFKATVLSLDMSNTKMITDSASDNDCQTNCPVSNLAAFVSKNGGFAGVNGTYFCPATYPECFNKTNSFDFPIFNSRLNKWINAGNLFWNGRSVFYTDGSGPHFNQNANSFSGSLNAGIVNFPGLIDNGNVQIDDNQSGLSDKQKAVNTKVGIGYRGSNVMIVIAQSVNMQQFAYVFKSLGASGALNLDTGGSLALYYNGRYIYGPGRDTPNAIIFAQK